MVIWPTWAPLTTKHAKGRTQDLDHIKEPVRFFIFFLIFLKRLEILVSKERSYFSHNSFSVWKIVKNVTNCSSHMSIYRRGLQYSIRNLLCTTV